MSISNIIDSKQTLSSWKQTLGDEFNKLEPYLISTKEYAKCWPCPNGCFQEIVTLPTNEVFAICGQESGDCDRLKLTQGDILLYKIDINKIKVPILKNIKYIDRETNKEWFIFQRQVPKNVEFPQEGTLQSKDNKFIASCPIRITFNHPHAELIDECSQTYRIADLKGSFSEQDWESIRGYWMISLLPLNLGLDFLMKWHKDHGNYFIFTLGSLSKNIKDILPDGIGLADLSSSIL